MTLTPAEYVISVLGGVRATARALGRSPGTVSKWQNELRGVLPGRVRDEVLVLAKRRGLHITEADLMVGRRVKGKKNGPQIKTTRRGSQSHRSRANGSLAKTG